MFRISSFLASMRPLLNLAALLVFFRILLFTLRELEALRFFLFRSLLVSSSIDPWIAPHALRAHTRSSRSTRLSDVACIRIPWHLTVDGTLSAFMAFVFCSVDLVPFASCERRRYLEHERMNVTLSLSVNPTSVMTLSMSLAASFLRVPSWRAANTTASVGALSTHFMSAGYCLKMFFSLRTSRAPLPARS